MFFYSFRPSSPSHRSDVCVCFLFIFILLTKKCAGWLKHIRGLFTSHDPKRRSGQKIFKNSRVESGREVFENITGRVQVTPLPGLTRPARFAWKNKVSRQNVLCSKNVLCAKNVLCGSKMCFVLEKCALREKCALLEKYVYVCVFSILGGDGGVFHVKKIKKMWPGAYVEGGGRGD